jgi:hypothetical protein
MSASVEEQNPWAKTLSGNIEKFRDNIVNKTFRERGEQSMVNV